MGRGWTFQRENFFWRKDLPADGQGRIEERKTLGSGVRRPRVRSGRGNCKGGGGGFMRWKIENEEEGPGKVRRASKNERGGVGE